MLNSVSMDYIYKSTYEATKNREIKKELDKEAFLELLVTQLKNQDPTEPLNNKDLIAQLSQLSSTEQIMNMSNAVQEMVNSQLSLGKLQGASLLGKTVAVNDNTLVIENGVSDSITYGLNTSSQVMIEIYDVRGKLVYSQDLGIKNAGLNSFVWNAKNNDGTSLPDGEYIYGVYIVENGQKILTSGIKTGIVEAIKFLNNELYLLVNGEIYPFSAINEISV
ncbi:flagellar hook assembly protein FlgD [Petrotoga sp. 9PWA.NaAc.5.4]|uniref:flagellar hook assembly protein FlgD n=1 Tax=Petrotoga sp. 9PWA.NaAc.5.4 TaxID=1434328 RepID=UPI000CBA407E|nr:flagellar hook assembly protein FlgD [Petrotoga sp. 9PWA.NaAc.5.4]PNR92488.1 flagellar hook capping protein FlgD [Petrotoga sp. 9PWA.NaAc.5.4]